MARLTLSEQVNAQASEIARLTAELHSANALNAEYKRNNDEAALVISRKDDKIAELTEQTRNIAQLEKELASNKASFTYKSSEYDRCYQELEQCHAVLDAIEGAPAREFEQEYGKGKRTVVARIAGSLLAVARAGGK